MALWQNLLESQEQQLCQECKMLGLETVAVLPDGYLRCAPCRPFFRRASCSLTVRVNSRFITIHPHIFGFAKQLCCGCGRKVQRSAVHDVEAPRGRGCRPANVWRCLCLDAPHGIFVSGRTYFVCTSRWAKSKDHGPFYLARVQSFFILFC